MPVAAWCLRLTRTADLINEMRTACNTSAPNISCEPQAAGYIQDWVEEISQYVKSVDPNHMVTGAFIREHGDRSSNGESTCHLIVRQTFAPAAGQGN